MRNSTQKSLEQINNVSRQLLSRIQTTMQSDTYSTPLLNEEAQKQHKKNNRELTELMSERQLLITSFFAVHTLEQISTQQELLAELLALDHELVSQSKAFKQIITEQVIKLKNSKKITKSYQKY